jgi:ribonuclease Z
MLACAGESVVVIDCGGDVLQRMLAAGLEPDLIRLLILTHEHPDHVSGFPLFMEKLWLSRRRRPLPVCGPKAALDVARRIFDVFDTSGWEGLPEIEWREVRLAENAAVWEDDEWRITAAPGVHSVPVIGLRIEDVRGGGVVAYSADTERADTILRLSRGADILVHEATGDFPGHTGAVGAAEVAVAADASRLVLVHISPRLLPDDLVRAREVFSDLQVGRDGARYPF